MEDEDNVWQKAHTKMDPRDKQDDDEEITSKESISFLIIFFEFAIFYDHLPTSHLL